MVALIVFHLAQDRATFTELTAYVYEKHFKKQKKMHSKSLYTDLSYQEKWNFKNSQINGLTRKPDFKLGIAIAFEMQNFRVNNNPTVIRDYTPITSAYLTL